MAEYVSRVPRVITIPGNPDPEKSTPGAVLVPGMPTEIAEGDLQNPFVKQMLDQKIIEPAGGEDKKKASEIEAERQAENAERRAKAENQRR